MGPKKVVEQHLKVLGNLAHELDVKGLNNEVTITFMRDKHIFVTIPGHLPRIYDLAHPNKPKKF